MYDVIIIGGSFAGLAAALKLCRARRKVTVLDTGRPRNRFAGHSHGVLGHDHKPPLHILAEARQQLARYPTIRLINARAERVSGVIDEFCVVTDDRERLKARRLILSYGVVDQLPAVPGYAENWGDIHRALPLLRWFRSRLATLGPGLVRPAVDEPGQAVPRLD
ncbi:FAD-dependent oxidoreductase [Xanthomonas sp. NCPPB 3582]|uniref:FAD-dependent oxidoreductase n=1 Tax=Xanthomonas sp. NCPPB 3582 TaxID=487557 RepID=UPI0035587EB7